MDMLDQPSWHWGLLLIALTLAFHATAVVMLGIVAVTIRARLETRGLWKLVPIMICMVAVLGLLLAVVHGIECGIWAVAYLRLGALDSPRDALLFSIDAMSTRGASGLNLQSHWQLMGALEAINGMLLFGVSTAWLFTVAQGYWWMIAAHVAPDAQRP